MTSAVVVRKIDAKTAYVERAIRVLATAYAVPAPYFRRHPGYPAKTATIASFSPGPRGITPTITLNRPTGGFAPDEIAAHEFTHYLDHLGGSRCLNPNSTHDPEFYVRMKEVLKSLREAWSS